MKILGIIFLIGWVAGQIVRLPGEFPVTVLDVAVAILLGKYIVIPGLTRNLYRFLRIDSPIKSGNDSRTRIFWFIGLIGIGSWLLGLRLFSWQESIPGGLYLLRFLGYLLVIVNAEKFLGPVKKYITPAFWIFIILAWAQYLFLPDTRFLLRYGWDEHYYRMIGTVLDPNYLGVMLGVIGIYLIYKYTNRQIDKWGKILLALTFGGLAMTYSRASWLVTGIGLSFFVIPYLIRNLYKFFYIDSPIKSGNDRGEFGMTIKIFIGFIIFGLILYMAPKHGGEGVNLFRTNSIEQRIVSWREGIDVWREHPWVGVGFDNYAVYKAHGNSRIVTGLNGIDHAGNAPSSSWILLLATIGIIGLGWLSMAGWLAVRNINRFWIGVLVMVGIHAIFNNTFFYPPVLGLLALIKAASED